MNRFRQLLVVWMMLWLPVSGALAAVMPLSGQYGSPSLVSDAQAALLPAMPCHAAAKAHAPGGGCTHCVLCHLAVALMLPSVPHLPAKAPAHRFVPVGVASLTSFFPEPLSPPPRSA